MPGQNTRHRAGAEREDRAVGGVVSVLTRIVVVCGICRRPSRKHIPAREALAKERRITFKNFFLHFCIYIRHTRPEPITKRIPAVPPFKCKKWLRFFFFWIFALYTSFFLFFKRFNFPSNPKGTNYSQIGTCPLLLQQKITPLFYF